MKCKMSAGPAEHEAIQPKNLRERRALRDFVIHGREKGRYSPALHRIEKRSRLADVAYSDPSARTRSTQRFSPVLDTRMRHG